MNVHGIYDTKASMVTFESRSEFQKYLQEEAGVSGSYFGFYAGVKSGWGESETQASQKYMALLHVDINRYWKLFILEPAHTTTEKFENATLFLRLGISSTLIRHENGAFTKRPSN